MTNQPPKLLEQVRALIRVKHYSIRTEDTDVHWIKRFMRWAKWRSRHS